MMLTKSMIAASFALIPLGGAPAIQAVPAACQATSAPLPAELAGWMKRTPLTAAATPADLASATLAVGSAANATLSPNAQVRYPLAPAKPGSPTSNGGLFAFSIVHAGTYRVALGAGAWIDVTQGGKAIASSAHGHGPDCSGVRKMVDFPLTPGNYILQVSGNASPTIAIMLARR